VHCCEHDSDHCCEHDSDHSGSVEWDALLVYLKSCLIGDYFAELNDKDLKIRGENGARLQWRPFCFKMAPNVCRSSVQNCLHDTTVPPGIIRWLLTFQNTVHPA
jgi:hypothetical protein